MGEPQKRRNRVVKPGMAFLKRIANYNDKYAFVRYYKISNQDTMNR